MRPRACMGKQNLSQLYWDNKQPCIVYRMPNNVSLAVLYDSFIKPVRQKCYSWMDMDFI